MRNAHMNAYRACAVFTSARQVTSSSVFMTASIAKSRVLESLKTDHIWTCRAWTNWTCLTWIIWTCLIWTIWTCLTWTCWTCLTWTSWSCLTWMCLTWASWTCLSRTSWTCLTWASWTYLFWTIWTCLTWTSLRTRLGVSWLNGSAKFFVISFHAVDVPELTPGCYAT